MRLRSWSVLAVSSLAVFWVSARAERPETLLSNALAETWGKAPRIDRPRISPDGSKLLFLTQDPQGLGVALVLDLVTNELSTVGVGTEEAYDIGWCEWANEERVICDLVFAVNADGTELAQIDRGRLRRPPERIATCGIPRQVGAIEINMDWVPEDPEHIVRSCGSTTQFNLYNGFVESIGDVVGSDLRGVLMSDGHNFTRILRRRQQANGYDRWYFREELGGEWHQFYENNPVVFSESLRPVGFGDNLNVLYHLAPNNGLWGVYAFKLTGELESEEVFTHPLFDIQLVDTMGKYDRVVAAAYLDERPQRAILDQRIAEVYLSAEEVFPGDNIEVVDESWDRSKYLLLVRPPRRAGNYYILDYADGTVAELGPMYDQLADVDLAESQSVQFPGADGGIITGHVTLPPGRQGTMPAVIIPRAIPSRLDIADPQYLVQYLVANGYAVLRVNHRGPDEYDGAWLPDRTGLAWKKAASDIDSAMKYLVAQGVAEEGKICALGRDIGAYAMFMNALEYPGELNCLVGIGSVAEARAGEWGTVLGGEFNVLRRDSSPIRRAKDIDAAILLFHGQYDGIIPILPNTNGLSQALDRKDFDLTFIEYVNARHDIERAPYRIDMLTRIGQFLEGHIGH